MNHVRLKTVTLTIFLCYLIVLARLFYWQILKYTELSQKVVNQNYKPSLSLPLRGNIYDVKQYPLALNKTLYQLSIYKPDIKTDLKQIINQIAKINPSQTPEDQLQLENFSNNQNIKWITLKDYYDNDKRLGLQLPGLTFNPVNVRDYPEVDLAKSILGYTKVDNSGKLTSSGGLESFYNKQLKGKAGFIWETKDATGQTILSKSGWRIDPVNGRDLHLSLDRQAQFIIELLLKDGIQKYNADSGSITIMKPDTGAIIAMTSLTASSSATTSASKNTVISDLYEPGSIFKPLVVTMALDKHVIDTDYICSKCQQPHQIGQYSISNWDNAFHPNSSLKDIIKNSDNIGMSFIIEALGQENFIKYFQLLGLTRKTGIDLQNETKPIAKNYWPEIDFATASFGQGFAITQIQMLTAFNTIANGGKLVQPHLVDYFQESSNIYPNKLPTPTTIFQNQAINEIKSILKYSVENGVVSKLKPPNIEVCAKSGTAQVAVKGGYSESNAIASYIGFSPCQDPKFTMIVTINNPRSSPWGSSTAAPIWYEIASKLLPLL